jgi:outer membrane receptor protein involved in Fe transport
MKISAVLALLMCVAGASPAFAQTPAADRRIDVTVLDEQGLAVIGARVTATMPAGNLSRTAASSNERFSLAGLAPGAYTLRVSASGFQVQNISVDLTTEMSQTVEVRLRPAGYTEQLIVTATRSEQRIADVPASVNIVTNEQIERSPAVVADDVLRQVPTFSLFRRTSSIAANPTAQGVSLRGIGPSGVSRTLVLLDDIPFNDPFGGWVYWTRVPMMNAERIEIIDGASSSLYGNYAMGGVINIVTNRPAPGTVIFKPQYGNRSTPKMDLFASHVWGRLGVTFDATTLQTDGYEIVAEEERGRIDNEANVGYQNVSFKVDYNPTDRINLFFRAGVFDEERNNGKIDEVNDTKWTYGSGGTRLRFADGSNVEARLFYDNQDFFQNTFAVPAAVPARSQSNLSLEKRVPTTAIGTMVTWSRAFQLSNRAHVVTAGTDFRKIDGDSDELTYALATGLTPLVHRVAGGTQRFVGVFAQDLIELSPKLQLTLSARIDSWRNFDAHNLETTLATNLPTAANRPTLPDKSDTAISPRVAALYRATDRVSVWGSLSNGFRAPTLKELYSPFRVGAVLTLSNETLGPERLIGQEAGISVAASSNITVRGTVFNNRVNDPIANVTAAVNNVPATPGCAVAGVTTCRQLQNLGSTNISGFQTDLAYRVNGHFGVSGAYVFDLAKVHESKVDAAGNDLTGRYLAEVPKHRASFQLTYTNPRYVNVAIENQFVGHQFDDDLNTAAIFPGPGLEAKRVVGLPKYSVTNLTLARTINRNVDVFFGVQNLFGTTYYVGTNPTTIGTPRLVNGGIRLKVGR